MQISSRLLLGLCVTAITYLAWHVIWVVGTARDTPASVFSPHASLNSAERFGGLWCWVVLGFSIALICTLVGVPRYSRLMGIGWLLAIAVLAVNASMSFGHFEPNLGLLFPLILAAGLLPEIHHVARRAA
jgi:hypothetical protein